MCARSQSEALSFEPALGRSKVDSTRKRKTSDNHLGRYFGEMASLSVLQPDQELEAAKLIEEIELNLWSQVLSYPQILEAILAVVGARLEAAPSFAAIRRAAKSLRASPSAATKKRYRQAGAHLSLKIYRCDEDRVALKATLPEIRRIGRGDLDLEYPGKLRLNAQSKAFKEYLRTVHDLFNKAERARNDFVKANLRLVVSIARRFNHGRMPLADLIQEGNIGLIKAVERYDYHRGYRFSTYASWWIRHAISRGLADKGRAVRLPVHMIDAHHRVSKARRELNAELGRPATVEEIAERCEFEVEKVRRLEGHMMDQAVSLDRVVSDEDGRRFVDFIEDPNAMPASDWVINEGVNRQVAAIFSELKPIERDILRKRFGLSGGDEQTLKEIGNSYSLSRERIRQLQEQALGKIRRALDRLEAV